MKKLLVILCLFATPCFAVENETAINALSLDVCQKQRLNMLNDKYAGQITPTKEYNKELKKILTRKQENKLKNINRLQKKADNRADKRMFQPDPNFNTFGMKPECKCKGRAKKSCPNCAPLNSQ